MGAENVNPHEELKWLEVQIQLATDLAALKPLYVRLNEILQEFPGDFDIQFAGNEIKQRLMERGTILKQREAVPPPFAPPPPPAPTPRQTSETVAPAALPLFDSSPLEPPPTAGPRTAEYLSQPPAWGPVPPPPPAPPRRAFPWTLTLVIGSIAVVVVALAAISWKVYQTRKQKTIAAATSVAAVPVDIATMPPGASVTVTGGGGNPATCTSNCKLALKPGAYQVSASLDGFDAAAGAVTVVARQSAAVSLTLQPQAQSVRVLTDLEQGKVVVDDQPPVDLQDRQLVLEKVAPGSHTVKVTGPNGNASFSFELAEARMPVAGPVTARNLVAVLVASFGKQARIVTNAGPWKLAVNGQTQSDAGPAGTDLTGFQPGVNEIAVGEGKDQHTMNESFGAAPMLTAFLKTDVNAGTLIVSTGQDDTHVFLNDKEYNRRTQHGQLRVQTLGKVTVRVSKSGFQDAPAQTVEVKKGAEVRLQFDLKPQPQFGSLQIHGAMPGTEIMVDQRSAGTVGPDGMFSLGSIQPGDHTVELRHEQYLSKRLQRSFVAGQTVALAAADVTLALANGAIRITRNPASAIVTYRRGDEAEPHEARGSQIELPPGSYVFSATAPGFAESTTRVQLAAGENREVDIALARERPAPPPPVVASGMTEFEDAANWRKDGDSWIHKGGGFVPYKLPPKGVFTFTVEPLKGNRSGQVRWCLQYVDAKNYLLYELDRKTFWAGVVEKGKRLERVKTPDSLANAKAFTVQIEVTPDRVVQKVRVGDEWKVLDTFTEPGRDFTQGKFGFLVQGNDEIGISDFKFLPGAQH